MHQQCCWHFKIAEVINITQKLEHHSPLTDQIPKVFKITVIAVVNEGFS